MLEGVASSIVGSESQNRTVELVHWHKHLQTRGSILLLILVLFGIFRNEQF